MMVWNIWSKRLTISDLLVIMLSVSTRSDEPVVLPLSFFEASSMTLVCLLRMVELLVASLVLQVLVVVVVVVVLLVVDLVAATLATIGTVRERLL